ncbi:MAG: Uma2 family endonuclease [Saprospiraceae bacterium]|nr:Uma2 family endonuclease [Saprospiraceae bacterium]
MTVQLASIQKVSFQEFVRFEEQAETKHEYVNGKTRAMAGASTAHNDIVMNVCAFLDQHFLALDDKYKVTGSDTMVYVEEYDRGRYPDITVVEGDYVHYENHKGVIVNPLMIGEVLSPSTEEMDEVPKFDEYQTLASFQEYVLIRQDKPYVKTYFREETDLWRVKLIDDMQATVHFRSIDVKMPMQRIYRKIKFDVIE